MSDQQVIYLTDDTDAQRLAAAAGTSWSLPGSDQATAALYDWGRRLWIWVLTRQVDWDRLAGMLVREQVERLHKESTSGRHPFHPEVLGRIDQLAPEVSDRLMASEVRSRGGAGSWNGRGKGVCVADWPELATRLNVGAVRVTIQAAVEQWQQIATDRVMLHEWVDWEGTRALVVQHKVSGLRARFHPAADTLGTVYAKSYKIDSIDPDAPGKSQDWNDYVGLGIGRRIYMAGGDLLPEQRWALGEVTTEAAQVLRRRLHDVEPTDGKRTRVRGAACGGWIGA